MKHLSLRTRCLLIGLAVLFTAYFGLLQLVAHTSVTLQAISLFPSPDALLAVALFFLLRFTCYLLVGPFLIALLVHFVAARFLRSRSS